MGILSVLGSSLCQVPISCFLICPLHLTIQLFTLLIDLHAWVRGHGHVSITPKLSLDNVLYVSNFPINLLSINVIIHKILAKSFLSLSLCL